MLLGALPSSVSLNNIPFLLLLIGHRSELMFSLLTQDLASLVADKENLKA